MKRNTFNTFTSIVIVLLLLFAVIFSPLSSLRQRQSVCRVTLRSYYELPLQGGDTLYLATTDEAPQRAACVADSVSGKVVLSGVCVSPFGHVLTSACANGYASAFLEGRNLNQRLQGLDTLMQQRLQNLQSEVKELDYYALRHSVVDDGYNAVMEYRSYLTGLMQQSDSTVRLIQRALSEGSLRATLRQEIQCTFVGAHQTLSAQEVERTDSSLLLRTDNGLIPQEATCLPWAVWPKLTSAHHVVAYNDWGEPALSDSAMILTEENPKLPTSRGGARVNRYGILCGLEQGGNKESLNKLWTSAGWGTALSWFQAWLSVPGGLPSREVQVSSAPSVPCVTWLMPDSTRYVGQTVSRGKGKGKLREGQGVWTDRNGVRYQGTWKADTLTYGSRTDQTGRYEGTFNRRLEPEGIGRYQGDDGEYYFGEWTKGRRQGWGFSSLPGRLVHCGIWRKGRFRGERMIYTADRVYGIDISRYQHEIKGRIYGINWGNLRITHLADDRLVQGKVDYPVSYVYIKSTQGDDILNRYYRKDARQARLHGIAVGSYHFFSTRVSGARQAAYFLKNSSVLSNDLPPMLDVEPSDRRVREMGGDEELVKQMRIWLTIVEKATGKRPVIYSYQKFIDDHLASTPELLRDYPVWVARYGEYKPYYRLLHWQLSPSGRVRGIHGDVDINVFNGTKEQFRDYLYPQRETE